jgi:hypothetical protein
VALGVPLLGALGAIGHSPRPAYLPGHAPGDGQQQQQAVAAQQLLAQREGEVATLRAKLQAVRSGLNMSCLRNHSIRESLSPMLRRRP